MHPISVRLYCSPSHQRQLGLTLSRTFCEGFSPAAHSHSHIPLAFSNRTCKHKLIGLSQMDSYYCINEEKLASVRKQKLWTHDPKYFKKVKISPSAAIKMMMHGQQGVEKGVKQNGKPVEVMGLLLGRPDTEDCNSLIITDAQALPIEGFETKVIADDENVINYMIELGDALEITRKERFCGWYHTHPFDVDVNGHCFLSNTDVTTQLQWQRSEDPHGNPWLAIVIDPLYSLAKSRPEMMAFRVYPPEFNARANETPDGTIVTDDRRRVELWGACWNRYYRLEIDYFMSALSQQTLGALKNKFLWQNSFCVSDSQEDGALDRTIAQIKTVTGSLGAAAHGARSGHSMMYAASDSAHRDRDAAAQAQQQQQQAAVEAVEEQHGKKSFSSSRKEELAARIGGDQCQCLCSQVAKMDIFGKYCARRYGSSGDAAAVYQAAATVEQHAMDLTK